MVREGARREGLEKVLIEEYRWPAGGLALAQLDGFIVN